jgi:hypothetical protein
LFGAGGGGLFLPSVFVLLCSTKYVMHQFLLHFVSFLPFSLGNDYEFSWKERLFREKDILPTVRDQGNTQTCVFQSLSSTTQIQLKRKAALRDPPETSGTKVCTESFVNDYEIAHGTHGSYK